MAERQDDENGSRQDPTSSISRRAFIQGVIAASAVSGVAAFAEPGAWTPGQPASVLTADQMHALTVILNRLIPSEGAMPAAGAVGVAGFIDMALDAAPHL